MPEISSEQDPEVSKLGLEIDGALSDAQVEVDRLKARSLQWSEDGQPPSEGHQTANNFEAYGFERGAKFLADVLQRANLDPEQEAFAELAITAMIKRLGPKRLNQEDFKKVPLGSRSNGETQPEIVLSDPENITKNQRTKLLDEEPVLIKIDRFGTFNINPYQPTVDGGETPTFRLPIPISF